MRSHDVLICGGGLAGLTMAIQLRQRLPSLSILLIDKETRPLPEAGHKVGESTVHPGGMYLCKVIGLHDYLESEHIEKYGLRYFFDNAREFSGRSELGRSIYDEGIFEYQLDRGILENDLRQKAIDLGVEFLEGCSVARLSIGQDDTNHAVSVTDGNETYSYSCKWLIDASGRRRLLQRHLSLPVRKNDSISSAWFRVEGKLSVDDFVPRHQEAWHSRVSRSHPRHDEFGRYNSTNHLMAAGRWVWLIPLASGYTSVGIVADENIVPFDAYSSREKALQWLHENEPDLAKRLPHSDRWLDFKCMRKYSYTCDRVFSKDRWFCTGEAGVFVDPWQSPGSDSIAISNSLITEMIASESFGKGNREALVDELNDYYIGFTRTATFLIQKGYPCFGDEIITTAIVVTYLAWSMSVTVPVLRSKAYRQQEIAENGWLDTHIVSRINRMNELAMDCLSDLIDWAEERKAGGGKLGFAWLDWWFLPFFSEFRNRMLSEEAFDWEENQRQLESLKEAFRWLNCFDMDRVLPPIAEKALLMAKDFQKFALASRGERCGSTLE